MLNAALLYVLCSVLTVKCNSASDLQSIESVSCIKVFRKCQNDYVAERWNGGAQLPEQSLDETDGHRAQRASSHRQHYQPNGLQRTDTESVSVSLISPFTLLSHITVCIKYKMHNSFLVLLKKGLQFSNV